VKIDGSAKLGTGFGFGVKYGRKKFEGQGSDKQL